MKIAKRLLSLLLVLTLVLSVPYCVFAAEAQGDVDSPFLFDEGEEEGEEEEADEDVVAKMYLLISNANPKEPHVWIYIENISDSKLMLGDDYTIGVGSSVSMGAWKARGTDESGIYFNLERYWVKDATYDRTYYMVTDVTATELKAVGSALAAHDYWNWVFNCGWFATSMWNLCSPKKVYYLFVPHLIRVEMILFGAKKLDHKIQKLNSASKVYKYHADGITVVSSSALYTNYGV